MQASDAATLQQMRARMAKEQAKGEAARHQQAIWDRLLEVRILLQKGLAASHQLPRPHAMLGVRSAVPELADGLDKVRQVPLLCPSVLFKSFVSATDLSFCLAGLGTCLALTEQPAKQKDKSVADMIDSKAHPRTHLGSRHSSESNRSPELLLPAFRRRAPQSLPCWICTTPYL